MFLNIKNRLAFTLAEVLITLGIIGVVAAMTIPLLISSYQKTQYITGLKKAYSIWNQALLQMASDSGCPGDLSCFFDSSNIQVMGDKIASYFKVIKNCSNTQTGCWPDTTSFYFDGSSPSAGHDAVAAANYKFITADGSAIFLQSPSLNCGGTNFSLTKVCLAVVLIDVNGLNPPNYFGRDIFYFIIDNDNGPSFYPYGGPKQDYWKTSNCCDYPLTNGGLSKFGSHCSARVMEDGWVMNY